jgi:hypothetical protein
MNETTVWTTHVKAAPDAVFAELSDLTNHAKWSPKPYRAEKTSEGPIGVGTTYKSWGWLPPKGKEYLNNVTITAFDPAKLFSFEAVDPAGPVVPSIYTLTEENGGTRVERSMRFPKPSGFNGVTWPLIFPMLVKPAIQKNLDAFRDVVEKG